MPFYCAEEVDRVILAQISSIANNFFSDPDAYRETGIPEKDKAHAMGMVYGLTTAWDIMRMHSTELLPSSPLLDTEGIIDA